LVKTLVLRVRDSRNPWTKIIIETSLLGRRTIRLSSKMPGMPGIVSL
jgi:hypothetical protein